MLLIAITFMGKEQVVGVQKTNLESRRIYLPLVPSEVTYREFPNQPTIFGVEASAGRLTTELRRTVEANAYWLRNNAHAVLWSEIEPSEGKRNWNTAHVKAIEAHMLLAAQHGLKLIQIVRGTPQWARKYVGKGSSCGPIDQHKYRAFAAFMAELVKRYSAPPFNVRHWEIWNEPDAPTLYGDNAEQVFGCWAEPNVDPYYSYGGLHYGFMLQNVYPAVKAADPESKVILGGLLLSCHPTFEKPGDEICGKISGGFLEGVFKGGGGQYFDMLAIHAYDVWFGGTRYANEQWFSGSENSGPSLAAKTDYVRSVMVRHGVGDKPIINTEYALICWQCKTVPYEFEVAKANYIVHANVIAMAKGLEANIWYSVSGWDTHQTQLINANGEPNLAHTAFRVSAERLGSATFIQTERGEPKLNIYVFRRGDQIMWVIWSKNGQPVIFTLPEQPYNIIDGFGNSIETNRLLSITATPLFIEFAPLPLPGR